MQLIVAGMIIPAVGLFSVINPHTLWNMRHSWRYKDKPEPSDQYLFLIRAIGVVLCAAGVVLVIYTIAKGRADAQSAAEVEQFLQRTENELTQIMGSEAGLG